MKISQSFYSATKKKLKAKDYSLVPSKYIAFVNRDEQIDYEDKMKALQQDITQLLQEEAQSKKDLLKVFDELGFYHKAIRMENNTILIYQAEDGKIKKLKLRLENETVWLIKSKWHSFFSENAVLLLNI